LTTKKGGFKMRKIQLQYLNAKLEYEIMKKTEKELKKEIEKELNKNIFDIDFTEENSEEVQEYLEASNRIYSRVIKDIGINEPFTGRSFEALKKAENDLIELGLKNTPTDIVNVIKKGLKHWKYRSKILELWSITNF
jgi:hypothetical protein